MENERKITCVVGDTPYYGNQYEHLACRLKKGTPVRFTQKRLMKGSVEGTGIFDFAWAYDGVNANVNTGENLPTCLFLACGDTIEVLNDPAELNLPCMHGEGV